jgi:hypothetical protein
VRWSLVAAFCTLSLLVVRSAVAAPRVAGAVSAPEWADQVCSSVSAWQGAAEDVTAGLESSRARMTRGALLAKIDLLRRRANALDVALRDAGSPDLQQGDQVAAALQGASARLRRALATQRASVATHRGAASSSWVSQVATRLSTQGEIVGRTFVSLGSSYPSADLDAVFDQSPHCELVHG